MPIITWKFISVLHRVYKINLYIYICIIGINMQSSDGIFLPSCFRCSHFPTSAEDYNRYELSQWKEALHSNSLTEPLSICTKFVEGKVTKSQRIPLIIHIINSEEDILHFCCVQRRSNLSIPCPFFIFFPAGTMLFANRTCSQSGVCY